MLTVESSNEYNDSESFNVSQSNDKVQNDSLECNDLSETSNFDVCIKFFYYY